MQPRARAEFSLFNAKSKTKEEQSATTARLKEIDQATKGFADRFVTYLVEACDKVAKDNPDPEARTQALRMKLFDSDSVYGIVSSPNPLGQLLDLCVLVTLAKINWVEEGRAKKVFGADRCQPVIDALNTADTEVWEMAARFLTPSEITETKKLIRQWRAKHKEVALVAYVRFDDFARARAGLEQDNPVVKGLFSQIGEANRSIQTVTDFGERALYYSERMPRLLQWQTERTVQAVMENPDIQRTITVSEQMSKTLSEETQKFDQRQEQIQGLLQQADKITANGKDLIVEARQTSATLTETIKAADQLLHTLNPPPEPGAPPGPPRKPFDINDYGNTLEKLSAASKETRLLVESTGNLESSPEFNARLGEVEAFTKRRIDHITMRVAQLIVFFFVMLLLSKWIARKWLPRDPGK